MAAGDEIPLPVPGAPVTLVVDDARISATVDLVEGERIELSATLTGAMRTGNHDAILEFVGDPGPCRVRGSGAVTGPDRIVFVASAAPQLLLRGDRVRAPIGMVVDVELGGEFRVSSSRDLRGGGVLVAGPENVEIGQTVRYRLHLPNREEPIEGWAKVARTTENGDFALHFEDLPEGDRAAIMLAVFAAQRGGRNR